MLIMESMSLELLALFIGFLCLKAKADGSTDAAIAAEPRAKCRESEKAALVRFKEGFINHLEKLPSWKTDVDCCQWEGVGCDNETGHVVAIDLQGKDSSFGLQGELRRDLLYLLYLRHIDVSLNDFSQTRIPEFLGSFSYLEYLDLSYANFKGDVPGQLGNISTLKYLDLSGNGHSLLRTADLNWLHGLSSLEVLDLSDVDLRAVFHWPEAINMLLPSLLELRMSACQLEISSHNLTHVNHTSLKFLDLSVNNLTGAIPDWLLERGHSLVYLNLRRNQLEGIIPEVIFEKMTSLVVLDLSENSFHGHLPRSLGVREHPSLRELSLSCNRLNGSLIDIIPKLSKLEVLDVALNLLEGVITNDHLLNFSNLRILDFSYNQLALNVSSNWFPRFQLRKIGMRSCQLGPQFPRWLQTQRNISFIDISEAGISDTVPHWFWHLSIQIEHMNLSFNLLEGNIPDLTSKTRLSSIDLSYNNFSGGLPRFSPNMEIAVLTANSFSGPMFPLCKMPILNIALAFLDFSNNSLSGTIPNSLNCAKNLVILNLGNNKLSGKIPDSIGYLSRLNTLKLYGNSLSGEIPSSLKNCNNLVVLDLGNNRLSGHIPAWIDNKFSNLMVLRLHSNALEGNIPRQLCQLRLLQILDLASNSLSGEIPQFLNDLEGMTQDEGVRSFIYYPYTSYTEYVMLAAKGEQLLYHNNFILSLLKAIDLSSNKLSGEIPQEITKLIGIFSLNLSRNNLVGAIPSGIADMRSLESLDLSRNQLSCAIPADMINLLYLEALNLSHNKLSGPIPTGRQFQTFDHSAYLENDDLCGPPLTKDCSEHRAIESSNCTNPRSQDNKNNEAKTEHGTKVPPFYIAAVIGFFTGFWGFWAALFFHKPWRHAYFRFIEAAMDKIYVAVVVAIKRLQRKVSDQASL